MITKTDIRLLFADEFGHCLDTVNRMAGNGNPEYIEWLEKKVIEAVQKETHPHEA